MQRERGGKLGLGDRCFGGATVSNCEVRDDGWELAAKGWELRKLTGQALGEGDERRGRLGLEVCRGWKASDLCQGELELLRRTQNALNALNCRCSDLLGRHEGKEHCDVCGYAKPGRGIKALTKAANHCLGFGDAHDET